MYCRHIAVNNKAFLQIRGPLLIACNHPNSFLDAIIIASLFKHPVYSLARGDAFIKPFHARLLRSLNMFPVYRVSEGAENLEHNYKTFDECRSIFKNNGIVLIFSEGRCINEWHLRPLKKGTARLAFSSWQQGIPLKVLPTGINYSSFRRFGKNIKLNFGEIMEPDDYDPENANGKDILAFNDRLRTRLKQLVIEADADDVADITEKFFVPQPILKKILLLLPALTGWIMHIPVYYPLKLYAKNAINEPGHYDSILVGLLFIFYPFYLLAITILMIVFTGSWWGSLTLLLLPFCGWSLMQLKRQI